MRSLPFYAVSGFNFKRRESMEKNRVIIAPDSFKGTMDADEVCAIIKAAVLEISPESEVVCIPMSDGGEGMTASYRRLLGGEHCVVPVTGPKGERIEAEYAILPDGTAVMEMASCAGLPLMEGELRPLEATTYGVGELLAASEARGCNNVLMGLGGSATNDCGIGMAAALGWRFLDAEGKKLRPLASHLGRGVRILRPERPLALKVLAACDVDNPLCGERGAARIFGPQKGLRPEQIPAHDAAMAHFAQVIRRELGMDIADIPGVGAAGGLGAGAIAFLGARLTPGAEMLLETAGMDALLEGAKLVITGEGKMDGQSASGKAPVCVAAHAKKAGVDCVALCGCIGEGAESALTRGITACYAASDATKSREELKESCRDDLAKLARRVLREYL